MNYKILIRCCYYNVFIRILSLRWIFTPQLGDYCVYNGHRHQIVNGTYINAWALRDIETEKRIEPILRKLCIYDKGIRVCISRYRRMLNFYKVNWLSLWVYSGIKPWMRGCMIWPPARKEREE